MVFFSLLSEGMGWVLELGLEWLMEAIGEKSKLINEDCWLFGAVCDAKMHAFGIQRREPAVTDIVRRTERSPGRPV